MYTIQFKFEQAGLEPVILKEIKPGQSLLEVALSNDVELHHNCGGVCACSTCHLYVDKVPFVLKPSAEMDALPSEERQLAEMEDQEFLEELSDKEEDFIDRAVNPRLNSRLGCQCLLLEGSGQIELTIPDQTQFLGE